jgi:ABC-type transport system involved in multi-copper enzyme maturation permease subunit
MHAAIAIASRELRDRSRLFLIAAVMAVVPFLAALTLRDHRQSGIALVAGFLAIAYSAGLAVILGISTIGRELSEKRAAFLFSTPVSPASMWFGKTAAALLICLGAFTIIILPTLLLAREGWIDTWSHRGALYAMLLCTALFLGGHVASTMLRSRSARITLDVAFLAMTLLAVAALFRPLLRAGAGDVALKLLIAMAIALVATLVVAPVWQLARGRIDPRRNHAALSTVVWGGVAVILAVAAAYVLWVISPPLSGFAGFHALGQSPNGAWVFVSGPTHGRGSFVASYLINTVTGERERLPLPPMSEAHFSEDGRVVAWLEDTALFPRVHTAGADTRELLQRATEQEGKGAFRLHTRRLESGATSIATPVVVPMPRVMQLSADGSRVTMMSDTRTEVYEVASGRLLPATDGESTSVKLERGAKVIAQIGASKVLLAGDAGMVIVDLVTKNVTAAPLGVMPPLRGRRQGSAAIHGRRHDRRHRARSEARAVERTHRREASVSVMNAITRGSCSAPCRAV